MPFSGGTLLCESCYEVQHAEALVYAAFRMRDKGAIT
jgi:hypothetical protein